MEPDKTLDAVKETIEKEMKRISEKEIVPLVERQEAEIKKFGKTTEETGEQLKAAGKKQDELASQLVEVKAALDGQNQTLDGFKSKIGDLEEAVKRGQRPGWDGKDNTEWKSPGALFTEWLEKDEHLLSELRNTEGVLRKGSPEFGVKSIGRYPARVERKAVVTSDLALQPERLPGILPILGSRLMIRDLMPVTPLGPPGLTSWVEETGFFAVATVSVSSITRATTTATVTTATAHGYRNGDRIEIAGADQAAYNGVKRITVTGATTFTFTVTGSPTTPATGTITANRMNNFGAAGFVAEGQPKPETGMKLTEKTGRAEVVAHWISVTRQSLDDLPGLRSRIDTGLLNGLDYKEEAAILYGPGSSPNVQGILTHPDVQKWNWSDGKPGDNKMDAIRRAVTRVQLAYMNPSGAVLHPLDFEDIEVAKGSDDHYIWMQAPGAGGVTQVWRLPLVVTPAIVETEFAVGAWAEGGEIRDREQGTIRFSESHAAYFTSNMLAILAEKRMLPVWYRPEAFVAGLFDNAPAAAP